MIDINQIMVQNVIASLKKKEGEIKRKIKEKTKLGNIVIDKIYQYVRKYASILELNEFIAEKSDYIFTKDLKGLSGAILHKLVFVFKMAYLKTIEEYTSLKLPILIDSPNGREVDKMNIDSMFTILQSDFREYQIIIASIYNNYKVQFDTIFEIKEKLLENANVMLD